MNSLFTMIATLIVGVALIAVGIADLFTGQRLTLAGDIAFIVAGAGALGIHVNGVSGSGTPPAVAA